MPALMTLRERLREQPLAGAKILGCIHMTIQTGVLIETLVDLVPKSAGQVQHFLHSGSRRRRHCCPGIPVFAWKGETEPEYEWLSSRPFCRTSDPGKRI